MHTWLTGLVVSVLLCVAIGAGIAHAGVHIARQYPRRSLQMEPMCRCDINDYQSSLGSATIPVSSRSSPFIMLYFSFDNLWVVYLVSILCHWRQKK
jgi:hypothetical protein